MSGVHQALVKKHCTDLAAAKQCAEAEQKRVAREAKKLAKERAKDAAHKEKEEQKKAIQSSESFCPL